MIPIPAPGTYKNIIPVPCCSAACCCLRELEDCLYMTGFQYRYVGVIGVGDKGKKTTGKNRFVFSVSFFVGATEKPTLKSRFSVGKKQQNRPKKTIFGFRFTTLLLLLLRWRRRRLSLPYDGESLTRVTTSYRTSQLHRRP